MPSLPLKVNVGIRDVWDSPESTVQKAFSDLSSTLGYEIVANPEWALLLAEVGPLYSDQSSFVPAVAGTVSCWVKALAELLEDDNNETWTDELLEKLKSSWSKLRIFLEVSRSKDDLASTRWDEVRGGFVVCLPAKQISNPLMFFASFKGQLLDAWNEEKKKAETPLAHRLGGAGVAVPGDDWADVEMDSSTGKVAVVDAPVAMASTAANRVEFMPDLSTMPRPDELLQKPPYHLFIYDKGRQEVEVQCSHSPTLQFISDYLKKWCRVNHQCTTKPPSVDFHLHECAFGLGLMYDTLTLYAEKKYGGGHFISPTIVLAIVEGVLGYEKTYTDGTKWIYRRDVAFKNL